LIPNWPVVNLDMTGNGVMPPMIPPINPPIAVPGPGQIKYQYQHLL